MFAIAIVCVFDELSMFSGFGGLSPLQLPD